MASFSFLKKIDFSPPRDAAIALERASEWVVAALRIALLNHEIEAEVFVGGSYAKGTLMRGEAYDIDVYLRCADVTTPTHPILLSVVQEVCSAHSLEYTPIHGSRDYFRIQYASNIILEIIPVLAIATPVDAQNVADASYAHTNYVRKKIKKSKKLVHEILLSKQFCKAHNLYGAESYIRGFSGYALECLIIHYGSFVRMVQSLAKSTEKIILDPMKQYKNKQTILISVNESKLQSPIVLIDPTWKERNVLAALDKGTFAKFQVVARAFLKKPSFSFFTPRVIDTALLAQSARAKKAELVMVLLETQKQVGDIAGTKLKKFSEFLESVLTKEFSVLSSEFVYAGSHEATVYYIVKPCKPQFRKGPLLTMKKHVERFRKEHPRAIVKKGRLYASLPQEISGKLFVARFLAEREKTVREMGMSWAKVA